MLNMSLLHTSFTYPGPLGTYPGLTATPLKRGRAVAVRLHLHLYAVLRVSRPLFRGVRR